MPGKFPFGNHCVCFFMELISNPAGGAFYSFSCLSFEISPQTLPIIIYGISRKKSSFFYDFFIFCIFLLKIA